jgi:hypothetical protein
MQFHSDGFFQTRADLVGHRMLELGGIPRVDSCYPGCLVHRDEVAGLREQCIDFLLGVVAETLSLTINLFAGSPPATSTTLQTTAESIRASADLIVEIGC